MVCLGGMAALVVAAVVWLVVCVALLDAPQPASTSATPASASKEVVSRLISIMVI